MTVRLRVPALGWQRRSDFAGLFKSMNGFPVVIRTLDPPLHEFLPKRENLMVDLAKLPYADAKAKKEMAAAYKMPVGDLKKKLPALLQRVEELHEFNPMLGHRGCRLGIAYPEITSGRTVRQEGIKVIPEVMIPLIGSVEEFDNQKAIVVKNCGRGSQVVDSCIKTVSKPIVLRPCGLSTERKQIP